MGYVIVDADGHITELEDQIRAYMSAPYNKRRPLFSMGSENWDRGLYGTRGQEARDAKTWLETLDRHGLESTVLFPSRGLGAGKFKEPDYAVAFCRAYNDFVYNEFLKIDRRLQAVAIVPLQDVPEAVKEARRAVKELGFAGIVLPGAGLPKLLGSRDYHPLYAEAERLATTICVHSTSQDERMFGRDNFESLIETHTLRHQVSAQQSLVSVVINGVPELFPKLKIGFFEAGCSWVPFLVDKLDEEWEVRHTVEGLLLKKKPSEYVLGNFYLHAEPSERLLPEMVRLLGADHLFYASDFPHWDGSFPRNIEELEEREDLSSDVKAQIFGKTAKTFFGLA